MRRTRGRSNNSLLIVHNEYTFFVTLEINAKIRLRHLPLCIAKVSQLHLVKSIKGKNTPSRLVFHWTSKLAFGRFSCRISVGEPKIVPYGFRGFPRSFQAGVDIYITASLFQYVVIRSLSLLAVPPYSPRYLQHWELLLHSE